MADDQMELDSHHVPNHEFTNGLPRSRLPPDSGWTMAMLPGDITVNTRRNEILSRATVIDAELNGFANASFLKKVTNNNCHYSKDGAEQSGWEHKSRWEAQDILPFIFLGPSGVAKDERFLRENGITMVLLIRDLSQEVSKLLIPRKAQQMGLETHIIEVRPNKLVSKLPEAIDLINSHLSRLFDSQEQENEQKLKNREAPDASLPGKVLVYDLTGNEAAAAVVAAYIMAMYSTLAGEAVFMVQSKRFSISTQFIQEVISRYYPLIRAKRDTLTAARATPEPTAGTPRGKKREMEIDETADILNRISMQLAERKPGSSLAEEGKREMEAPFSDESRRVG